jgi:hypothetical protein
MKSASSVARSPIRKPPVSTTVKKIVFSPNGGQLLQALAHASNLRALASFAYLECAAADMEVVEAFAMGVTIG